MRRRQNHGGGWTAKRVDDRGMALMMHAFFTLRGRRHDDKLACGLRLTEAMQLGLVTYPVLPAYLGSLIK